MRDAGEIAREIASGKVSARETVLACIKRIEATHAAINAVVVPRFEEALKEADLADTARALGNPLGQLHGVPVTIKESFDLLGTPTTGGLTNRAGHRPAADAWIVARLKAAGAIVLGKTNVSQLLLHDSCSNPLYGQTNNPWRLDRSPGASSGGEAAILAVGGSALGFGSDIGGSVRLPAHACGLHSFKPTSGKLSLQGHISFLPQQESLLCQPGPLARSVSDLKFAMRVLSGETATSKESRNLRIGLYTNSGVVSPSPSIRRAVSAAGRALQERGMIVEEWQPPNFDLMWRVYLALLIADGFAKGRQLSRGSRLSSNIRQILFLAGLPKSAFPIMSAICRFAGQTPEAETFKYGAEGYDQLAERRTALCREFLSAMDKAQIDAILCPVFHLPALHHRINPFINEGLGYTSVYNFLGMPAGVVAATRVTGEESDRKRSFNLVERAAKNVEKGSAGLPMGVQVVARHSCDGIALEIMSLLEEYFRSQPEYPSKPEI
jgi:fatty acid amide hydrolase